MPEPSTQPAAPYSSADQLQAIARRMRMIGLLWLLLLLGGGGAIVLAGYLHEMGRSTLALALFLEQLTPAVLMLGSLWFLLQLVNLNQQERLLLPEKERPWSL